MPQVKVARVVKNNGRTRLLVTLPRQQGWPPAVQTYGARIEVRATSKPGTVVFPPGAEPMLCCDLVDARRLDYDCALALRIVLGARIARFVGRIVPLDWSAPRCIGVDFDEIAEIAGRFQQLLKDASPSQMV